MKRNAEVGLFTESSTFYYCSFLSHVGVKPSRVLLAQIVEGDQQGTMQVPPKTLEDALNLLLGILDRETMDAFASRSEEELKHYHCTAGVLIREEFKLTAGNEDLIESCRKHSGQSDLDGKGAAIVILKALWENLRQTRH